MTITVLTIAVIVLSLIFDFLNGIHDSSNVVATMISTRALPPARAPEPPADENTRKSKILRATGASATTSHDLIGDSSTLSMSEGKRYSLAVIQGAATGHIYSLTKPRTLMGRSGSDINLGDAEASRQHAALEILGDHAILRDLGSTNGTFVDNDRVDEATLMNHGEFRVGSHVLMFIVTGLE